MIQEMFLLSQEGERHEDRCYIQGLFFSKEGAINWIKRRYSYDQWKDNFPSYLDITTERTDYDEIATRIVIFLSEDCVEDSFLLEKIGVLK